MSALSYTLVMVMGNYVVDCQPIFVGSSIVGLSDNMLDCVNIEHNNAAKRRAGCRAPHPHKSQETSMKSNAKQVVRHAAVRQGRREFVAGLGAEAIEQCHNCSPAWLGGQLVRADPIRAAAKLRTVAGPT